MVHLCDDFILQMWLIIHSKANHLLLSVASHSLGSGPFRDISTASSLSLSFFFLFSLQSWGSLGFSLSDSIAAAGNNGRAFLFTLYHPFKSVLLSSLPGTSPICTFSPLPSSFLGIAWPFRSPALEHCRCGLADEQQQSRHGKSTGNISTAWNPLWFCATQDCFCFFCATPFLWKTPLVNRAVAIPPERPNSKCFPHGRPSKRPLHNSDRTHSKCARTHIILKVSFFMRVQSLETQFKAY